MLAGQVAAVGCVCPCPQAEQVAAPLASSLFQASSAALFCLPEQLQQGCSQGAHLTGTPLDLDFLKSQDGAGRLSDGEKGPSFPVGEDAGEGLTLSPWLI